MSKSTCPRIKKSEQEYKAEIDQMIEILFDIKHLIYIFKREMTEQNYRKNMYYFVIGQIKETDILYQGKLEPVMAELIVRKKPIAWEYIEYKDKAKRKKEVVSSKIFANECCAHLIAPYIAFDDLMKF